MTDGGRRSRTTTVVVVAALVFLYLPLAVVVLFSFNEGGSLTFPFTTFSTKWYQQVFSSDRFTRSIWYSTQVAAVTSVFTFLLGTAAAFGLSRSRSRLRPAFALLLFLPLTLPGLFVGLSLLSLFNRVHIDLSFTTVAIAHLVYVLPYFLLIAVAALQRLDPALEEVGSDLGGGPFVVFRRVTFPQVWPLLVGASLLSFALSFDEFIITFLVIGPESTLPLYIFSTLRRTVDPSINAISSLLLGVSLLLLVLAAGFTVRGGRRGAATLPIVERESRRV